MIAADGRFRQLGQPGHQVDAGIGIVGGPADTHLFVAHARVLKLADGERPVFEVRWRVTRGDSGTLRQASVTTEAAKSALTSSLSGRGGGREHGKDDSAESHAA